MKIVIIGSPGSGKSTLGLKLHKILNIPLYHLDQYFWGPGWVEPDRAEFKKIHDALCDREVDLSTEALREGWIIEGMAIKLVEYRIKKADIIVFLDMPRYKCFWCVFKRMVINWGNESFGAAQGCPERGLDLKFLKYIWYFNSKKKPYIQTLLKQYAPGKKIFIIRNQTELHDLIQKFESYNL